MSTQETQVATPSLEPAEPVITAPNRWRAAWDFSYGLVMEVSHLPLSPLAKQAAYSLLYAIPSIVIVIVSVAAIVDQRTDAGVSEALQKFIVEQVPADLQPLLSSIVEHAIADFSQGAAALTAVISLGIAIWGASGGVGALIFACNRAYGVRDTRSWFRRTLLKLALMIIGGVGIVLAFIVFSFGHRLAEWLAKRTGRIDLLINILNASRGWALFLVAAALVLLYMFAPDVKKSLRWLVPGTLAATLAVAITFWALDYVLRVWTPGSAYGAASSVLVLLWTLWLMSVIVVAGAGVNAFIGRRFDAKLRAHLASRVDGPDPEFFEQKR